MGSNIEEILTQKGMLSSTNGEVSVFKIGDRQLDEDLTLQVMCLLSGGEYVLMRKHGVNILQGITNVSEKTAPLSGDVLQSVQAQYKVKGIKYLQAHMLGRYLMEENLSQLLDSLLEDSWGTDSPLCLVVEDCKRISLRQFIL